MQASDELHLIYTISPNTQLLLFASRLKKGDAFHYDLLIVALLNGFLTLYGMPMMHGVLPHSPLHARSLADIEEQVEEGHLREV